MKTAVKSSLAVAGTILVLALLSAGCFVRVVPKPDPSSDKALQSRIAALVADLDVPKGGLHAPYCMPFPRSKADEAYERLLRIGKAAVPKLIAGLGDKNTYRRAHCAGLLGEIGDPRAVEPLCAIVASEQNARSWVIEALGQLHDERAIPALTKLLSEGSGELGGPPAFVPRTGRQAAEALVEIGGKAIPALRGALSSKDADARANAKYAFELIAAQAHPLGESPAASPNSPPKVK